MDFHTADVARLSLLGYITAGRKGPSLMSSDAGYEA